MNYSEWKSNNYVRCAMMISVKEDNIRRPRTRGREVTNIHAALDEDEYDSDFDPFEDDLDSVRVYKERMAKHKKQSATEEENTSLSEPPKGNPPRYKDMHYGRMGLSHSLLQSAGPNTGGANCAA